MTIFASLIGIGSAILYWNDTYITMVSVSTVQSFLRIPRKGHFFGFMFFCFWLLGLKKKIIIRLAQFFPTTKSHLNQGIGVHLK